MLSGLRSTVRPFYAASCSEETIQAAKSRFTVKGNLCSMGLQIYKVYSDEGTVPSLPSNRSTTCSSKPFYPFGFSFLLLSVFKFLEMKYKSQKCKKKPECLQAHLFGFVFIYKNPSVLQTDQHRRDKTHFPYAPVHAS